MFAHIASRDLPDLEAWQDAAREPFGSEELMANPVVVLALALLFLCAVIALLTVPFVWLERKKKKELARARQRQRRRPRRKPFMKPSGIPSLMSTGKLCPSCGAGKRRSQPWCLDCSKELATRAMKTEELASRKMAAGRGQAPAVRLTAQYRDDSAAGSW